MPRRILEGNIVSDKMDKTVTVLVERRFMHPVYKKYVRKSDKYSAHDETNTFKTGDRVQIEECRPISKNKRWQVIAGVGAAVNRKPGEGALVKAEKAEKPVKAAAPKKAAAKPKAEKPVAAKKPAAKKTTKKSEE